MQVDSRARMKALRAGWVQCKRTLRAVCGLPDYEAYVEHLHSHHPERTPPTRAEFQREREAARYSRGRSRCC